MPIANAQISATIGGDLSLAFDLTTATAPMAGITRGGRLDNGTGAGQVDKIFSDTRTLAPSATETLDLAGVLLDYFGTAITMARVRGILISASAANTNNVVVGGVANAWATLLSPAATGLITLRPGAFFAAGCGTADATGYAVTPATGDLLQVANSAAGTSVTYDVVILGASV